ncbi:MAG: DNA polymerase III subunit gamma/tau [Acidobacteriia bacterium]|nr:DNA polymerase III subunit gamma/tau [Terriglobia bacterium]
MSYQVIARKYRPQQFDDVIGQSVITTTLRNAIEQKRIGHAYLFSGVRGVGKTTSARIFAKALNCAKGPTPTPCDQCDSCREIKNGNAVDVIEIDAASNRGIDDIRQLRENVKYRPARDRYKIYIIDEAHQLTDDAWDALLKTLEEPPDHIIFMFATTERHKLKPTILSRCQNFSFRTLSYHEIYESLEKICRAEGMTITPAGLSMLVHSAEGSIRDAQSILDQVISFCGTQLEESKIRELLGLVSQEYLDRLSEALIRRDSNAILQLVNDLHQAGFDPKHFCREAIQHLRNLMIVRVAGTRSELLELPADQIEALAKTAANFSEEDLVRFFHLLARTDNDLKWSTQPRLHLELGLVRLVQAARLMSIEEFLEELKSAPASPNTNPAGSPAPRFSAGTDAPNESPYLKKNTEPRFKPPLNARRPDFSSPATPSTNRSPLRSGTPGTGFKSAPSSEAAESPVKRDESQEIRAFREAVGAQSKLLGSFLERASRIQLEGSTVHLFFTRANEVFYDRLNTRSHVETLKRICQNSFGRPFQVTFAMLENAGVEPAPVESQGQTPMRTVSVETDPQKDPVVQSFVKTFRGEIVGIKKKQ